MREGGKTAGQGKRKVRISLRKQAAGGGNGLEAWDHEPGMPGAPTIKQSALLLLLLKCDQLP